MKLKRYVSALCAASVLECCAVNCPRERVSEYTVITGTGRQRNGQREFVVVPEDENGKHKEITITQHDVRELQLAKAAVRTGIEVLLRSKGITGRQIDQVIVAGAFGSYLDLTSAITIGMFPSLPLDRFCQVGNAAGTGARMALISKTKRLEAEELARRIQYIELSTTPGFDKIYTRATRIEPMTWSD